jgi:hypothetical protein
MYKRMSKQLVSVVALALLLVPSAAWASFRQVVVDGQSNACAVPALHDAWVEVAIGSGLHTITLTGSDWQNSPGSDCHMICVYSDQLQPGSHDSWFFTLNGEGDSRAIDFLPGGRVWLGFVDTGASDNSGGSWVQVDDGAPIHVDGAGHTTEIPQIMTRFLHVEDLEEQCRIRLFDSNYSASPGAYNDHVWVLTDQLQPGSNDYWLFTLNGIGDLQELGLLAGAGNAYFGFISPSIDTSTGASTVQVDLPDPFTICPDGSGDLPTIQAAIDATLDGDVIELCDGTFRDEGNRDLLYNGKSITIRSASGDPARCIIDCEGSPATPHRGLGFDMDEGADAVLAGVTVTHGYAPVNPVGEHWGGAIFCSTHAYPGAIPTIRNCVFSENAAVDGGGAVYTSGDGGLIEGCTFLDNTSDARGGGISIVSGVVTIRGCTLSGNSAAEGGGIHGYLESTASIERTIVTFGESGGGVVCDETSTVTVSCSDVYGNAGGDWSGRLAGQEGTQGNLCADPVFCDATGGNYTLSSTSPCLYAACGVMGAHTQGCWADEPYVLSIGDVGNDQGRQVRVTWVRSGSDAFGEPSVTGYALYRRQDQQARGADGPTPSKYQRLAAGTRLAGWDYILTVPARGDSIYQCVAPTLCDSTAAGICWSTFFVSAVTADPLTYFDSASASGYSIDNLAPAAPDGMHFETPTLLAWDESEDADFRYFTVYGSAHDQLDDSAVEIGSTVETSMDVPGPAYRYVFVTATDFAGNEGEAATLLNPSDVAGSGGESTGPVLYGGSPNPAFAQTTVRFDLPRDTRATLTLLDVSGRVIRTLHDGLLSAGSHGLRWDGRTNSGALAPTGVYLCRLQAEGTIQTRKLMFER